MSILDVFCLVLGTAVHIAYVIATGRLFCDDASTMPDAILPEQSRALGFAGSDSVAPGAAPTSAPLPYGKPDSRALEITYVVARGLQILFTVGTDALFLERLAQPTEPVSRAWMKVGRGMFGIISGTILFVNSTPDFMQKLMNEFSAKGIDKDLDEGPFGIKFNGYYISKAITIYSLGLLGDVITFAGGVKGVWPVNVPAPGPVIELPQAPANARAAWSAPAAAPINGALPDTLDTMEFWFLIVRAMVLIGLMIYQCIQSSKGKEYGGTVSFDIRAASKLVLARDLLNSIARLPGFTYTVKAGNLLRLSFPAGLPYLYEGFGTVRFATTTGAVLCHSLAEFDYLGF